LTVPTSGTIAVAEDYGDTPTPNAVWVTPDGAQVGGAGAWRQLAQLLPEAYAANWAVTDWYLDGTVGLDTNNGTTALTPLRTGAELLRRLGPYALWGQSVTVHVLANGMTDALVLHGELLVTGTHLDVIGTPTVLASDTVLTYTNLSHATPSATQLVPLALADWTPYVGSRVRFPTTDAVVWIGIAGPGGVGLNVAQTSRASRVDPTNVSSIFNTSAVNPAPGDALLVEQLPQVPAIDLDIAGPMTVVATAKYPVRQWLINSIDCPQITVLGPASTTGQKCGVFGSKVGLVSAPSEKANALLLMEKCGCRVVNADFSGSFSALNVGGYYFCTLFTADTQVPANNNFASTYGLWQGFTLFTLAGSTVSLTDNQLFDVPGAASIACYIQGNAGFVSNLSGARNAGFGLALRNNVQMRATGTMNLQGTVSNGRLAAAPAISLTLPQLLQASDFAQRGTSAAMVAGTITVTVPWYDNVNQKVTATHAVFAGTPGILSVQQISTTQFTITSSSAIDTSTVNWQISPLGRNIFITTA
jgi:hypothetical protein